MSERINTITEDVITLPARRRVTTRGIRRRRLEKEQINVLENEHVTNNNWTTARITALSKRLNLSRTKIYKWSWDRRKRDEHEQRD